MDTIPSATNASGPAAEPVVERAVEHAVERAVEPVVEPAAEPVIDPSAIPAALALRAHVAAAVLPPHAARPAAARPGDAIVLVGGIGRGGAAVLATACGSWLRRRVPPADLVQAAAWPGGPGWDVAALAARLDAFLGRWADADRPNPDPLVPPAPAPQGARLALGDGGLAAACHAIARAADVVVVLDAGAVPLHAGTARICDALGVNPLDLQSAGTLLFTAGPPAAAAAAAHLAAAGHDAHVVGHVRAGSRAVTLAMGGSQRPLRALPAGRDPVDDVLARRM